MPPCVYYSATYGPYLVTASRTCRSYLLFWLRWANPRIRLRFPGRPALRFGFSFRWVLITRAGLITIQGALEHKMDIHLSVLRTSITFPHIIPHMITHHARCQPCPCFWSLLSANGYTNVCILLIFRPITNYPTTTYQFRSAISSTNFTMSSKRRSA